jgi:hypothetical protein
MALTSIGTGISKEMVGWIRFYGAKPPDPTKKLKGWDRRGRDRMVDGFTTICAISAYHH